MTGNGMLMGKN